MYDTNEASAQGETVPATLAALARYFLVLGATGFGGPIALVGYMQRDLVERRRWFTAAEFNEGLAFSQLAPGPLAAQLAVYLGWARGGAWGATVTAAAFVAPSLAIVIALAASYLALGDLPWMRGIFYGVGAAVIAIIARSAVKLTRVTLGRDRLLWLVWVVNAAVVAGTGRELVSVILVSGVVVLLASTGWGRGGGRVLMVLPPWLLLGSAEPATPRSLVHLGLYFLKAGALVFGSGLAIVPFLYGGVVGQYGWLSDSQFLDAVAVAMITPGPVVITVAFIGYLAAGPLGGFTAALGVFAPVWLSVIVLAPFFARFVASPRVRALVNGVTAAAAGAIAGSVIVLAQRAIVDIPTTAIALTALLALVTWRRLPEPALIAGAAALGLALA